MHQRVLSHQLSWVAYLADVAVLFGDSVQSSACPVLFGTSAGPAVVVVHNDWLQSMLAACRTVVVSAVVMLHQTNINTHTHKGNPKLIR